MAPPPRSGWRDRVNDVDVAWARLELERGHTIRLDERLGVGVGESNDVAEDVVAPMLASVGRRHDFAVDHAALDFYGLCARCRSKRR